jgi:hypothetical protein
MTLADLYLADPRVVLVPIEHLSPAGTDASFRAWLQEHCGWSAARVALFDAGFALYWSRGATLARQTRTWMAPRVRHVAVVADPASVRPYVQLLNTSAWMLYASDFDPERSHPELAAYLFALGDRMALSGEVTLAAIRNAAWWFDRSDVEIAAFVAAARHATRPDAEALRAVADAIPWLRSLRHETLRPPTVATPHRAIPGTGLLVPQALEREPEVLVDRCTAAAREALDGYRAAWRAAPAEPIRRLCAWLTAEAPPLLVTAERGRIVWDPAHRERTGPLRAILKRGDGAAVDDVAADLAVVARHSRAFRSALVDASALPRPHADSEQRGYTYLHHERALVAYDLDEAGMERLAGPALPYARAMLGARTVHEWAHLAVDAGWVPCVVDEAEIATRRRRLADGLAATIAALPERLRAATARDVAELGGDDAPAALARIFLARMPDFQANLLAQRFLERVEMETYVRHNVRTLRGSYDQPRLLRMLVRYLFEYQYLAFSAVEDRREFFVRSTWFDVDFFATGALDEARFTELAAAGEALCACWAVDEARFLKRDA